jgi:hypothetical protein
MEILEIDYTYESPPVTHPPAFRRHSEIPEYRTFIPQIQLSFGPFAFSE